MTFRSMALAALVPVCVAFVHDFPGSYDNAPNVATTSLELEAGKGFSLSSNAIHWRKDLFDSVKSGGTKKFFNGMAWYRKVGTAKVGQETTLGGKAIAAGEYTVNIKVTGENNSTFSLEFKKGETAIDVPLDMKEGNEPEDHLLLVLTPRGGNGSKEFALKVFYGDMKGTIAGTFGAAKH